jgi:hypothetical protein
MKTFFLIISALIVAMGFVYQSGYYSRKEPITSVIKTEPVKKTLSPVKLEEPQKIAKSRQTITPKQVRVIYVPKVIEKVYIKEVYHTETVVYQKPEQRDYRQASQDYNCCSNLTGFSKDRCYEYADLRHDCQEFVPTTKFVRFNNNWR